MLLKRCISTLLLSILLFNSNSQQRNISISLSSQYNRTVYDYTLGNNPWGIGIGIQAFYIHNKFIQPTIEVTGAIYLEDDKVLRSNPDGTFPPNGNDIRAMINILGGLSFHPGKTFNFSITAGPSFINQEIYAAVKPSIGFYLSKDQKWSGNFGYINIFNRIKKPNKDFGSLSIAVYYKIY